MLSKLHFCVLAFFICTIVSLANAQSSSCGTATTLIPSTSCCSPYDFLLADGNSALGASGCVSTINDDGWFKFTATGSATNIELANASNPIACIVYSGTCANLIVAACDDNGNNNAGLAAATAPGATYFIRIIRTNAGAGTTTGTICVTASNNIIANGNFELGATSWSACGNSVEALNTSLWHGGTPPYTPNFFAEVDAHVDLIPGTADDMLLCQNISGLTPGTEYTLCMNVQRRPGPSECTTSFGMPATVSSNININNGALSTTVSQNNTQWEWETVCYTFTAVTAAHQLTITPVNNSSCGMLVTNITLTLPAANGTTTLTENEEVCFGEDYTFPDGTVHTNITADESYVSNILDPAGCDTIITTNITVNPVYNIVEDITVCQNDEVTYPDGSTEIITANTSHISELTSSGGCDSTITTNVSLNGGMIHNITENVSLCINSNITYPDGTTATITANTSHTSNLTTALGCDSIIVTNVTMLPGFAVTVNETICHTSDYTYPDGTTHTNITLDESYVSVLTASNGCDSTITTNITIELPAVNAGADQTVCEGTVINLHATGGGTIGWNNSVTDNVPFTPPTGITEYIATVTSANGCINRDTLEVTCNVLPVPGFTAVTEGCEPLYVTFTNTTAQTQSCLWNFGNSFTSTETPLATAHYETDGQYTVSLTVTDNEGCTGTTSVTDYITVHPNPVAGFTASTFTVDLFDPEVNFNNTTTNGSVYSWDFGDGTSLSTEENPSHSFSGALGNYEVVLNAESEFGCRDAFSMTIIFKDLQVFFVPNAFTPDGDEFNNEFKPFFSEGYDLTTYEMTIFDRWGGIIFVSRDVNYGWDGTFNGSYAKEGAYTWNIVIKKRNNDEKLTETGHLMLIR